MIDFIAYLNTLKPEDWKKMATPKWTVKDVVAHMVSWEKESCEAVVKAWETKQRPWFMETENYEDFNVQQVEYYAHYTPNQLLQEWKMWQKKIWEEIEQIGYDNVKAHPELFDWLMDGQTKTEESYTLNEGGDHYRHHYEQIKKAVES